MKPLDVIVAEVRRYVPQHPFADRPYVLAEVLNEHVAEYGSKLEEALRELPAEDQAAIGLDDITHLSVRDLTYLVIERSNVVRAAKEIPHDDAR